MCIRDRAQAINTTDVNECTIRGQALDNAGVGLAHLDICPELLTPVSYTHLDVYKRQVGDCVVGNAALKLLDLAVADRADQLRTMNASSPINTPA